MPTRIAERELALEAADDVGQDLRRAVTVFFRKLLTYRYDTESELAQSPLWQELPDIFRRHCDLYTDLAIVNLSLDRRGCLNWVKKEIEADHDAIMIQHFGCGADGSLRSESDSVTSGRESWRAMHHFGFWNWNSVIGAFARELTHARSNAVRAAKIRIFSHSDANRGRTRTGTAVTSMTEEPAFSLSP